jgi:hypothetical protein
MINDRTLQKYIFQSNPLELICTKEYIKGVLLFGSYLSIVHNKKVNASGIFTAVLQDLELREVFIFITGSQHTHEALLGLLQLYPNLLKSKNTKKLFSSSFKKKRNDKSRKKNL